MTAVAGYVLAGGASRRFGSDKALARLGGETLLARMCRLVTAVHGNVRIVAPQARYGAESAEILEDRWPGEGPLGGVLTALHDAAETPRHSDWNLILSCDMPFLTEEWLRHLVNCSSKSNADVVVPKSAYGLEPLCACWRTSARAVIQQQFESGVRKVTAVFAHLKTEVLDEVVWKRFDNDGRLFWNMNTAQDYEEAVRIFEAAKQ